jgi:hypothetical protein
VGLGWAWGGLRWPGVGRSSAGPGLFVGAVQGQGYKAGMPEGAGVALDAASVDALVPRIAALAALRHPNLARVHGACSQQPPLALVERCSGSTLSSWIREHRMIRTQV